MSCGVPAFLIDFRWLLTVFVAFFLFYTMEILLFFMNFRWIRKVRARTVPGSPYGNIKLRHLKEDKIFLKFYNDSNLYEVEPLNEIASEKMTARETHGANQLISLNGNKDFNSFKK